MPSPTVQVIPRPDVVYVALIPTRPENADQVHLASGTFESYRLFNAPAEMVLTLRDARSGKSTEYLLSENTTLNGRPLNCPKKTILGTASLCRDFPADIIPGKTRIALLYWSQKFSTFEVLGTNEIVSK
jgi:hypothetical protein